MLERHLAPPAEDHDVNVFELSMIRIIAARVLWLAASGLGLALLASCSRLPVGPDVQRLAGGVRSLARADTPRPYDVIAHLTQMDVSDALAKANASEVLGSIPELKLVLCRTPAGATTQSLILRLQQDARVISAEPNSRVMTAEAGQSSAAFSEGSHGWNDVMDQTALVRIGAIQARTRADGSGAKVAILDTGIDLDHPALANAIELPGIEPGITVDPGNDRPQGVDTNLDGIIDGSLGHGTHVAGIVHAVAPQARLLAVRVLDSDGVGDAFGVARGIVLAVGRSPDVLNLSLGLSEVSQSIQAAVDYARATGAVVVAAAGNRDQSTLDFPASYPPVIAVAGTDAGDRKAAFSDYGDIVDIAAPSEGILSTYWGGSYATWSGTSMAAPFVSGTAALLYSRLGEASPTSGAAVETLVRDGAMPLGAIDPVYAPLLGAGRVDALGSVERLLATGVGGETLLERRARH